jgi:uncharacterized protein YggE
MHCRLLFAAFIPLSLQAQVRTDSTIVVSATRTAHVAPDRGAMFVIVEGTAETAADANTRVETKLRAVNDALKSLSPKIDVERPVGYGVSLAQNPNGYPMPANPGSFVSRSVMRIQISRLDQISAVVAAAMAAGATSTSSLSFESSVADSVRRDRIAEAVGVARNDAQALATALGGHLGALVDVTTTSPNFGFPGQSQLSFDNRFGQQASPPDVVITATVTMRYRIVH